jgi:hypothetical protein
MRVKVGVKKNSTITAAEGRFKFQAGGSPARGDVASAYWFNGGGESSATVQVNEDGTVIVSSGSVDIGGSRASMALMAAETLGIDHNQIRSIVADTSSVGYAHVTGGSSSAVRKAARHGKLRGIGIAAYIEACAMAPSVLASQLVHAPVSTRRQRFVFILLGASRIHLHTQPRPGPRDELCTGGRRSARRTH